MDASTHSASIHRPQRPAGPAQVTRRDGEVELRPGPPPRVVGPGRLERRYQERIQGLEADVAAGRAERRALRSELDTARLVERGTGRLVDRLEVRVGEERRELERVRAQGHRLLVTLGALQRENEQLRRSLAATQRLAAPRRSWLARLLAR